MPRATYTHTGSAPHNARNQPTSTHTSTRKTPRRISLVEEFDKGLAIKTAPRTPASKVLSTLRIARKLGRGIGVNTSQFHNAGPDGQFDDATEDADERSYAFGPDSRFNSPRTNYDVQTDGVDPELQEVKFTMHDVMEQVLKIPELFTKVEAELTLLKQESDNNANCLENLLKNVEQLAQASQIIAQDHSET